MCERPKVCPDCCLTLHLPHLKTMNEKLDTLQAYLERGYYIAQQDGLCHLFDKDGEGVAHGATLRGMMCHVPERPDLDKAVSTFAESAMKVANALYHEKV